MTAPPATAPLRLGTRVALRRLAPSDLEPFQAYRNDPQIGQFQDWALMGRDEALGFLSRMSRLEPVLRPGQWGQIAIADAGSNDLLGDMGLFLSQDGSEAEVGITLAAPHHGKGLASEAMQLAMTFVFDTAPVRRIICGADDRNLASLRLIKRLGFNWTHTETMEDGARDEIFAMTRQEFDSSRTS
ncbi:N-acetyltransferase [Aliishimia ponticola]|uniref:N-acetyltransferase n=1 Tax=Aliishimia ponticola TaxID=2499833 RepID=A0A4S4N9L2_9RHOB|nr:GNAT family N-acetyltransferase [Aliishimia ponticola]THH34691.1 N-acetyltransferase [Aliishimia ponticola]